MRKSEAVLVVVVGLLLVALTVPLDAAAGEPERRGNNLVLTGALPGAAVLRVRVKGPDLEEPIDVVVATPGGALQAGLSIPVGKERLASLQATSAEEKVLYEGELLLDVADGFNAPVELSMKSVLEGPAPTVQLASHRLEVQPMTVPTPEGAITRVVARLFDASGGAVELGPDDVRWDIDDPWVREHAMPCKGANGSPPPCIEFLQHKPDLKDTALAACFKEVFCRFTYVPPSPPVWAAVSLGFGDHACALTRSGSAYCWGQGEHGQLGVTVPKSCKQVVSYYPPREEPWGCSTVPVQVVCSGAPCDFVAISAGFTHTCAIDSAQDAWCWGSNFAGELGDGTRVGASSPQRVSGGFKFTAISAGAHFTCGLTTTQDVRCWGDNATAIVPTRTDSQVLTPTDVDLLVNGESIDAGWSHVCARAAMGRLYCWGGNAGHVLGSDDFEGSPGCSNCPARPRLMQFADIPALEDKRVDAVSAGMHLTCAHVTTGENVCWGTPVPQRSASPTPESLSAGGSAYCTVVNQLPTCAGNGHNGVLGDGSFVFGLRGPARPLPKPDYYRSIEMGIASSCGLGSDDRVYCWGLNVHGKLGDGTLTESAHPVEVALPAFFP